jgi:hypothetical protein
MTCIVGIQHEGRVYIGGDSAGVADYSLTLRADAKVFTNGPYVMGFTSSFRMGQLLRYALKAPTPKGNIDRFMVTTFIDAVRDCLDNGGFLTTKNGVTEGGTFLVGVNGHLFSIEDDFQVGRSHDGYAAVGCGQDLALGSLFTTRGEEPRARIKKALQAAAHHSAGVAAPFVIKAGPA